MEILLYGFFALCYLPIILIIFAPNNYYALLIIIFGLMLCYSPILIHTRTIEQASSFAVIILPSIFSKCAAIKLKHRNKHVMAFITPWVGLVGPILYGVYQGYEIVMSIIIISIGIIICYMSRKKNSCEEVDNGSPH